MTRILLFWTFFTSVIFLAVCNVYSIDVTLGWDANTEPNISGYKIYYGFISKEYNFVIDVGNQTTYPVTNLSRGTTYFFAVTAYNNLGAESDFSNEILFQQPEDNLEADLEIIDKINPDILTAGCNINLGFSVFNHGPDNATNVEINIMLEPASSFSVSESLCNYYELEGIAVCNLGEIPSGEEIDFEITATTPNFDDGITIDIEATTDAQDPILKNNKYSKQTTITYPPYDFNCDDNVDYKDLTYFLSVLETEEGDANYDPRADLDGDGVVSIFDFMVYRDYYFDPNRQ